MRRHLLAAVIFLTARGLVGQGAAALAPAVRAFVSEDAPVIALIHARVLDGTGAPARADQTIVIDHGQIAAVGNGVAIPAGAKVIDLTGEAVLPGLVGMHEHMFYPVGAGLYGEEAFSFPRLYLAGGVTTIRTAGNLEGYTDLNLKREIDAGHIPGPVIYPTAPYMEGPTPFLQMHPLRDPAEAAAFVNYWAGAGADNYKAYMHITRAELGAAIDAAHALHLKITGHLCSVGYHEAAALGIDDLEHGLVVDTEFVPGKQPDECPNQNTTFATNAKLNIEGPEVRRLIRDLVAAHVAMTSTLPVFETMVPNRPPLDNRVLDALTPETRAQYLSYRARVAANPNAPMATLFPKEEQFEHDFAQAGGLLLAGLDPTGGGGVVAGFGDQREVELLVEAGFTPEQAIQVASLNGATYLGIADRVGSIAAGKQADLVVVRGDPSRRIADIENVVTVFKNGIGYDSAKLIAATHAQVGLH